MASFSFCLTRITVKGVIGERVKVSSESLLLVKTLGTFLVLLQVCCNTRMTISMRSLVLTFVICCCLTTVSSDDNSPILHLTNNGPAVFGSNITFHAYLENGDLEAEYEYEFHDYYPQYRHKTYVTAKLNASAKFAYPKPEQATKRDFEMDVTVFKKRPLLPAVKVAGGSTFFRLSDTIVGDIKIYDGEEPAKQQVYVSTNQTVNLTFVLHDPDGFFAPAYVGYLWKIRQDFTSLDSSIAYNFTKEGSYNVLLTVYATFPDDTNSSRPYPRKPFFGVFFKQIEAKDPIKAVNFTGNVWLPHKDVLNLEVNCSGSGPFNFCKKVFLPNETVENITCPDETFYTNCAFPITHYFPDPGDYWIMVYIKNDVSEAYKKIQIHSYDVSHKMQLSVVIIPVACSILVFVIIVLGIAWHIHNRKQIMVEVADFDFTSSEVLIERTFFERLRDTFMMFWWKGDDSKRLVRNGHASKGNSVDYIDEDYLPVV